LKLKKLTLKYFKGFSNFTLDLEDGKNASIHADNGLGKSTIYDSVLWLLFNKDSQGKVDFDIKTRNDQGEVIPQVDHEVTGLFDINGKEVELKKVYSEQWTKKRGSAERVFDGHVAGYWIDGVPKSKGEFQKFIDAIAPEKLFMALMSPTYFNEQLTWQERRQMLMGMCPEVSDAEVLDSMTTTADKDSIMALYQILKQRSIEDAKKVETATRKKINEELTGIPGRIDEATRAIPEDPGGNLEVLATKAQRVAAELAPIREEKIRILSGGQVAEKQKELAGIETAIINLKNKHAASVPDVSSERKQLHDISNRLQVLSLQVDGWNRGIAGLELQIEKHKEASRRIAARWTEQNALKFTPGGSCPTCGQDYPENLLAVQEADFNRAKSKALETIIADGKANEAAWKEAVASLEEKKAAIVTNQTAMEELQTEAVTLQEAINSTFTIPDATELPEHVELIKQRDAILDAIIALKGETGPLLAEVDQRQAAKQTELDTINRQITAIESAEIQRRRIAELKAKEKDLAKQFEQSEKILFLIEQFIKVKVSRLESSINEKFSLVNWKLFDTAINGGISETCVCTVDGVPYPSVNNGNKVNSGLDIIRALSRHHGFAPVVFIDNSESVTAPVAIDCQVVKLVVSEADKALRVSIQ